MKEKELLRTARHVALATVNEDGSPHNTPLFFIHNESFSKLYWGSHPDSLHSKNIQRTGKAFVVVFDSKVSKQGGLYLTLDNARQVDDEELTEALHVHNIARAKWGKEPLPIDYYQSPNQQKMYLAEIVRIEVYSAERDVNGTVVRETRKEIKSKELFA